MATTEVILDPFVEIDGVDYSSIIRAASIKLSKEKVDDTTSGADGKTWTHGLSGDVFSLTAKQDSADGGFADHIWRLYNNEEEFTVIVAHSGSTLGSGNAGYEGTCKIGDWPPLDGKIGDLSEVQIDLDVQGKASRVLT